MMDELKVNQTRLRLVKGNIVEQPVEAIVNAANSSLAGGGGVDGAIHRAAGTRELLALTRPLGGCPTGQAVITGAAKMQPPIKYIIHAVGPVYRDGQHGEPAFLGGAYTSSLKLADQKGVQSVAFPAISTGIYGYPQAEAAQVALKAVVAYIQTHPTSLKEILFVLFDTNALHIYERELQALAQ